MTRELLSQQPVLPNGYYYHELGYLWFVLPVDRFKNLPESVAANQYAFERKSEFHVTVIRARKVAEDIAAAQGGNAEQIEKELLALLTEHVRTHPIEFVRFDDDIRLATSPELVSLAGRCVMQGVEEYFQAIQKRFNFVPPMQPFHVSLYTLPGKGAVGIDTTAEMESFAKVSLPNVQNVLTAVESSKAGEQ